MELSIVSTVQGAVAGSMVEGALREAGIPAMTRPHQQGSWMFPGAGGGLGPVDVLVPAERLADAQMVLAAFEAADQG